jgi:DNA-binding CsgD family transcriptional regulator
VLQKSGIVTRLKMVYKPETANTLPEVSMYATHSSLYDRSLEKTPEQLFINSLRKEFELSPAESAGVLELAKRCLFGELPQTLGRLRFLCASKKARHGKPLGEQDMIRVTLTLDGGIEDLDVLRLQGSIALRQLRILRLTEEAFMQGGLLTQEDLGRLLQVSSRTIRSDIRALVHDGNTVHTRGFDHDIGRSISHKTRIVELFLKGYTYDEIMRRTRHSAHSIKRYITSFGRLLLLLNHEISNLSELSRLLNMSERLCGEYLVLFNSHKKGDKWPPVYLELLEQLRALYPAKKKAGRNSIRGGRDEN